MKGIWQIISKSVIVITFAEVASRLLYYLILLPAGYLPLPVLYALSDFLYLLIRFVFKYRKGIIDDNLKHAFPDYTNVQISQIRNNFYRHFCDLVIETVKTLTISKAELAKRISIGNPGLLESPEFKGRHLVLLTAHYGNWEWGALQLSAHTPSRNAYGIYLPLNNRFFDKIIRKSRHKFGTKLISTKELPKILPAKANQPSAFAFIADQNPSNLNKTTWVDFFGREVPVAKGPERYARQLNAVVMYGHIEKLGRGRYVVNYELISDDVSIMEEGLLLKKFMQIAEDHISNKPDLWLWSHKRWKHKKKLA